MTLLKAPYNSNYVVCFPGGNGRTLVFKSPPESENIPRSYSVSIGQVLPVKADPTLAAVVAAWAVFSWGGDKGGVTELIVDAQRGCRVQVDAGSNLQVELLLNAFGADENEGFLAQITLSEETISGGPNTYTDVGQEVLAQGSAFVGPLPNYARHLTLITDIPQSYPPAGQVLVRFWGTVADYTGGQPMGAFVVDNNAQKIPIPQTANFYTLELAAGAPALIFAFSQFELTF